MLKPQYRSRTAIVEALTAKQIFAILTADPVTGVLALGASEEAIAECHDRGLITPGAGPGEWKLAPDGWEALHGWRTA
ncbi:hypothetical protein [Azospirillum sp. SYSU D00513]|uniref:hypothetical protein n=1 Tax=Azospirillum sp. SYSU D00513 TaxID=2812561 RepID=UPI001A969E2E|nr:hypothetical protein [Azospirillum sp. SYSU D00513]